MSVLVGRPWTGSANQIMIRRCTVRSVFLRMGLRCILLSSWAVWPWRCVSHFHMAIRMRAAALYEVHSFSTCAQAGAE